MNFYLMWLKILKLLKIPNYQWPGAFVIHFKIVSSICFKWPKHWWPASCYFMIIVSSKSPTQTVKETKLLMTRCFLNLKCLKTPNYLWTGSFVMFYILTVTSNNQNTNDLPVVISQYNNFIAIHLNLINRCFFLF